MIKLGFGDDPHATEDINGLFGILCRKYKLQSVPPDCFQITNRHTPEFSTLPSNSHFVFDEIHNFARKHFILFVNKLKFHLKHHNKL